MLAAAALSAIAPARADDLDAGRAPMRLAAVRDERPKVAIVIDDVGLDWRRFQAVNRLPMPVTIGFLPYGPDAQAMLDSKDPRHDAILHLPMEPHRRKEDAGPDMVPTGAPDAVRAALHANLAKLTGFSGVNNHTGSKTTADETAMRIVLSELEARGLYFLDSMTTPRTKAKRVSATTGATVIEGDLFLDGDFGKGGEKHVRRQLRRLEKIAEKHGEVIAIGHPYPATISVLNEWALERGADLQFVRAKDLAAEVEQRGTGS
ncbi:divergent polysaccharide deacetylase family protein [Parvularcula lutaonensis]|uniref:Divergent polysaccharide deacetylase family protein n=1 Tax=Parvularcula lutaonensis TaxID=491923 RepID=A0ABV7MCP0_9PROT